MKVVFFGNCQASQIKYLLSEMITDNSYELIYLSSNSRTGGKKTNQEIIKEISNCDILIAQPLSEKHNELSSTNISKIMKKDSQYIRFPYIFNSGVISLMHAPSGGNNAYGEIFGKEAILALSEKNLSKGEIIIKYINGEINFNLKQKFKDSLEIMKSKESKLEVQLTNFISKNYQKEKLFITHNHPTNILLYELIRQVLKKVKLPVDLNKLNKEKQSLPKTNCPITPYDKTIHNYQFPYDENWKVDGINLIDLILFQPKDFTKLKPGQVNNLRDAAIMIEKTDLKIARSLMNLAYIGRPEGKLIQMKLRQYNEKLKKI